MPSLFACSVWDRTPQAGTCESSLLLPCTLRLTVGPNGGLTLTWVFGTKTPIVLYIQLQINFMLETLFQQQANRIVNKLVNIIHSAKVLLLTNQVLPILTNVFWITAKLDKLLIYHQILVFHLLQNIVERTQLYVMFCKKCGNKLLSYLKSNHKSITIYNTYYDITIT